MVRPSQLLRAVDNLINNALKYATQGQITAAFTQTHAQITVEDDGPGIAKDQQGAALRPFVRLDKGRNQSGAGGVGLGLSIVRDVVNVHGGTLTLGRSRALGGLSAKISIPLDVE